jgi:hypothetical protein
LATFSSLRSLWMGLGLSDWDSGLESVLSVGKLLPSPNEIDAIGTDSWNSNSKLMEQKIQKDPSGSHTPTIEEIACENVNMDSCSHE